jgi:hypothetical protein
MNIGFCHSCLLFVTGWKRTSANGFRVLSPLTLSPGERGGVPMGREWSQRFNMAFDQAMRPHPLKSIAENAGPPGGLPPRVLRGALFRCLSDYLRGFRS